VTLVLLRIGASGRPTGGTGDGLGGKGSGGGIGVGGVGFGGDGFGFGVGLCGITEGLSFSALSLCLVLTRKR